ncbi:hypothetical protein FRC10_011148 [Ceratobasidium sp. 414]|nr:hypothetical protein FRC10_011148 [Ceratobasidium sp. 414]
MAIEVSPPPSFHDTSSNYVLPNDKEEHNRLSYQHEAIKLMVGGNYMAPLTELNAGAGPQNILDVCSGSGQWALEIAKEFPKAKVVGIDLSKPVQESVLVIMGEYWVELILFVQRVYNSFERIVFYRGYQYVTTQDSEHTD